MHVQLLPAQSMPLQSMPALVLNADFRPMSLFPLSIVSWQEAISAVVTDRVSVVAEYDAWARSPSVEIRLPSVIALRTYRKGVARVAFTRFNVFLRDRFTCQYCGQRLAASALTFDHVVPRVRGGITSWTNVVAACVPCNTAKGSSMRLKPSRVPARPTLRDLMAARRMFPPNHLHASWLDYLYWDVALEA